MLSKRIIPCLDVKDGQTVKGIRFVNLRQAGDPVELGAAYAGQGADELVYLDITATIEGRGAFLKLVQRIAARLNIPFTVGGGIRSVYDVEALLNAGADKIGINSAAVQNPQLIDQLALEFGSQCVVLAIDAKKERDSWLVYTHGGRSRTDLQAEDWAKQAVQRGAGEILLTSMNHDGEKSGFDIDLTRRIAQAVNVPVIASGGAGRMDDFVQVFQQGKADAALAASIFHFNEISIKELKTYLKNHNIEVRL